MALDNSQKDLCLKCKGSRLLCGKPSCPLLLKARALGPVKAKIKRKKDLDGFSPPSFFVGHKNYPKVYTGPMVPILSTEETSVDYDVLDNSDVWFGKSIEEIVSYRAALVRTMVPIRVHDLSTRIIEKSQELIMARQPTAIETQLEKEVRYNLLFDKFAQPMGPTGSIKRLLLQENPKIDLPVEKTVSDIDLKANKAVKILYDENVPVSKIIKILSAGLLGVQDDRKLVPTRWSITATDDIIGRQLIDEVKWYRSIDKILLFHSNYLDNWYYVLLLPKQWAFEVLEAWMPDSFWNPTKDVSMVTDHELFKGRTTYASNVAGGYYAARLGVLEYLNEIKRSAAVIVFREIRSGYYMPLGVWQCRENVRNAMKKQPKQCDSIRGALKIIDHNFIIPIEEWTHRSKVLKHVKTHRSLIEWFIDKRTEPKTQKDNKIETKND